MRIEPGIIRLPITVTPNGTSIPSLTASLHKRTDQVAWYIRSDGYHEVFIIKTGLAFDGSAIMEYYPGNDDFGKTAWCIRDEGKAARYYANLCLGKAVEERLAAGRYNDATPKRKRKIRGTQVGF